MPKIVTVILRGNASESSVMIDGEIIEGVIGVQISQKAGDKPLVKIELNGAIVVGKIETDEVEMKAENPLKAAP